MTTPQDLEKIRQFLTGQMSARQPGQLRGGDFDSSPRMTIATPEAEQAEYLRRQGGMPTPPSPEYGRMPTPLSPAADAARAAMEDYYKRIGTDGSYSAPTGTLPPPSPKGFDLSRLFEAGSINPDGTRFVPDNTRYGGVNPDGSYRAPTADRETPIIEADPEYDGFVDSGTGERGYMGGKYMPTPMAQAGPSSEIGMVDNTRPPTDAERANRDAGYALALSDPEEYDRRVEAYYRRPVPEGQLRTMDARMSAADVVARMAQAAPASTAYMPPPTAAQASTAYMPPPTAAPVNTAYMPSRKTARTNTAYMPPLQAASSNTAYMPATNTAYVPSTIQTYGMSNATTTPTYAGQMKEPSYSPKQAGKYNVDGTRLRNTGGLFNDLNAFFGRPQT